MAPLFQWEAHRRAPGRQRAPQPAALEPSVRLAAVVPVAQPLRAGKVSADSHRPEAPRAVAAHRVLVAQRQAEAAKQVEAVARLRQAEAAKQVGAVVRQRLAAAVKRVEARRALPALAATWLRSIRMPFNPRKTCSATCTASTATTFYPANRRPAGRTRRTIFRSTREIAASVRRPQCWAAISCTPALAQPARARRHHALKRIGPRAASR